MKFSLAAAGLALLLANFVQATPIVATGSLFSYSGTEGPFNTTGLAGTVPVNLALNPLNLSALPQGIASSVIAGGSYDFHQVYHLNDGSYSNSRSWIGDAGQTITNINPLDPTATINATWAGIDLKASSTITSFAFGSDNGNYLSAPVNVDPNRPGNSGDPNENITGPDTGFYHDRTGGTYLVQFTTAVSPTVAPDSSWTTIGAITLADFTNDAYRHLYNLNSPLTATGLRFIVPTGDRIDEIELYGPPVPEPATVVLLALGVAGMFFARRRFK